MKKTLALATLLAAVAIAACSKKEEVVAPTEAPAPAAAPAEAPAAPAAAPAPAEAPAAPAAPAEGEKKQ